MKINMKIQPFILVFIGFLPLQASAFTIDWLLPMTSVHQKPWSLQALQQSTGLYDCGIELENTTFCSDKVNYYRSEVTGKIELDHDVVSEIELSAIYSNYSYSNLQHNLTKDGYELTHITTVDGRYDVYKQLKLKSLKQVNREVVTLLNTGDISSKRELVWLKRAKTDKGELNFHAIFNSSKHGITIRFTRQQIE